MKKIILLLFIFSLSNLFGLEPKNIKSIEADFEQQIIKQNKTLTYKGKIYIKLPAHALWIYEKPKKKIYITGKKVIIEESKLEQVIITSIEEGIDLSKILSSANMTTQNNFEAKVKSKIFKILTTTKSLDSITYKDEFDNDVVIKFFNTKINQDIALSTFDYEVPSGFDIIRQ